MTETAVDQLLLDIMWIRLEAMVNEQAAELRRTAFSHLVREAGDLSVGIFDLKGRLTVQAVTGTPGHIFALPATVRILMERYGLADCEPGDVLITNDPYIGCGHQYDVTVVTPIFDGDQPVAIYGSTCHVVDIGGRHLSADGTDVFEEGLRIPPMKLYRRGQVNHELLELVGANVRNPHEVMGDINALVGANEIGGRRLCEHLSDVAAGDFTAVSSEVIARSERAMRTAIASVPDGTYTAETVSDSVADDEPIRIAVRIDVHGDEMTIDYEGSSPPSRRGINVVFNYTQAYTIFSLKCALAPGTPNNDGSLRPVTVKRPENSLLNAQEPSPVAMRHVIGHLIPGVIFRALAQAVPDRIIAESSGAAWVTSVLVAGRGDRARVSSWVSAGGMGARPLKDGLSCTSFPTGTSSVPTEILEKDGSVLVRRRSITPDSGGAGEFRGGCGQTFVFEITSSDGGNVSSSTDRITVPARGEAGGAAGAVGGFYSAASVLSPKGSNEVPGGDEVTMALPGGGGFGDPYARPSAQVRHDVIAGYVSIEGAARDYGVVLEPEGLSVDVARTARLRASRKEGT